MSEETATKEQVNSTEKEQQEGDEQPVLTGEVLEERIKLELEQYLSREYLATSPQLVSQLSSQMYVPITTLISILQLPYEAEDILKAAKTSSLVSVSEDGTLIKPNFKLSRNTVILREIPPSVDLQQIKSVFNSDDCAEPVTIRPEIANCWYLTFHTEEDALKALEYVRTQTLNGAPIRARIKSEHLLRTLNYYSAPEPGNPYLAQGGSIPTQYYQTHMAYVPQRSWNHPTFNQMPGMHNYHNYDNTGYRDYNDKSMDNRRGRGPRRHQKNRRGRNNNRKQPENKQPQANSHPPQFQLGAAYFPPLGEAANEKSRSRSGYNKDYKKFTKKEIIDIVSNTDVSVKPASLNNGSLNIVKDSPQTSLFAPRKPDDPVSEECSDEESDAVKQEPAEDQPEQATEEEQPKKAEEGEKKVSVAKQSQPTYAQAVSSVAKKVGA
eukprot:CAMPEP_0174262298 /NCGR_PEP_ID=MMETSP0439-20130205/12892_1 /TAXON_ID=0 /ORGANISM="Stereomyxa ramosa, Strain Chinc5" /LENGTH=436 /DNA_ID=CAMNT_0015346989 /DNA_START=184 /DNA_END=1494 /DNA_ORIENTATION=-